MGGNGEKKALSYSKDRRNRYGENDKSSRRNIRRNKRNSARADRRRERQALAATTGLITVEAAEDTETKLHTKSLWSKQRWRKWPDVPLAEVVESKLRRRAGQGMNASADTAARIDQIRRRTN